MNYCFLDTNIFYGSKKKIQNFFSANFKRLISYTEYGIIQLIMPEVTLQELYAHFDENIDALYELVGQAGLPIVIIDALKNSRDKNLIRTQLTDAFQQFLRDTKCVTLPMNSLTVNASEFVRRRYAYEAPFTPEKEDEYQDLFAVQALRDYITAKAHEKDRLIANLLAGVGYEYESQTDPRGR